LTAANVNFLSLERTAKFYADCMDVWLRLRELGGFEWIETRYEDMVANLEVEGRRITSFLGLPWHDTITPVHTRGLRRWEHYAEALAPLQSGLAKYCQAFNYRSQINP
jgi:hypothetical protein